MKILKKLGIVLFWLVIWQTAAVFISNQFLMAGPVETGLALLHALREPVFFQAVASSVGRVAGGFLLAFVTGSLLAVVCSRADLAKQLLSPLFLFAKAVPVASFAVILLIFWGNGGLSLAISFLVALPIFYSAVLTALENVNEKRREMMEVFHIPFFSRLFFLYRPALAPYLESALRTAIGMSMKAGVAAEVIGMSKASIGGQLYQSKIYLDMAGVFAWTIVVILISFLLEKLGVFGWQAFCRLDIKPGRPRRRNSTPGDIRMEGVEKAYGNQVVLSGMDMTWEAGKAYCLMAPSGAGKTTILSLLAGLQKPDAGEIPILPAADMVFQEDRLLEEESARKNVLLVCSDEAKTDALLRELLPGLDVNIRAKELSGGMRRRVSLARALAAEGDTLLLDEPFTGLDEENRLRAIRAVEKYRRGRTLIAATHEQTDAERLKAQICRFEGADKNQG